jgi:hypothetical protein
MHKPKTNNTQSTNDFMKNFSFKKERRKQQETRSNGTPFQPGENI